MPPVRLADSEFSVTKPGKMAPGTASWIDTRNSVDAD